MHTHMHNYGDFTSTLSTKVKQCADLEQHNISVCMHIAIIVVGVIIIICMYVTTLMCQAQVHTYNLLLKHTWTHTVLKHMYSLLTT